MNANTAALDPRLLKIALVFILGGFMPILDTTIVNVAIRDFSRTFNAPLPVIQWVSTGYMLALAMAIPLTGWAADRFGTKRLYMTSIALFVIGSALSGAAWSAGSLILFRALQGFGGGMIIPVGMTIMTHAAGPQRIGRMMGIVGVPMLLGPIIGPILGGFFVDDMSWRWIFLVNIPIGAVAVATATSLDPDEAAPHHTLDWRGLLLLSPGLAIFVYGLAEMASGRGIDSVKAVGGVAVGLALVLGFVIHARNREGALLDVRLFARRTVVASALTTFLFGIVFFGLALLMPLYFQVVRGQSALAAGLLVAMQGVGAMLAMPLAGRLTDRSGAGRIVLVGLTLCAIATLRLSWITNTTPLWQIEATLFLNGLGAGSTMMPAMSAALSTLKREEVGRATSGLNVALRVGGSIGTALLAVVLADRLSGPLPFTGSAKIALSTAHQFSADADALVLPTLGAAFGYTFRWAFGIILLSIGAALYLPRTKSEHLNGDKPNQIVVE